MSHSSLRRQLVIPITLLVIGVSAAIGWVSMKAGTDAVHTLTQRMLVDMVNRINLSTERHIEGALIALESVAPSADRMPKEHVFSTDMHTLEDKFWAASGLFMDVNNYVYFGGKDGRFVGVYRISKRDVQLFWREPEASRRDVYHVTGIGDRSELIRSDEFDPRKRPWYQTAMRSEKPVWSKIYNNFSFNFPTITLAKAVFQKNHEFAGVLATDMTLMELSNFLRKLEISKNSVAYIVDADGYIVATSGEEVPQRTVNGVPERMRAVDMKTALIRDTFSNIGKSKTVEPEVLAMDLSGGAVDVAISPLGVRQGLNWQTIVAVPRADFMREINKGFMQSVVIAIACIIFALTIGLTIVERVVRDIRKLTAAAEKFGNGEPMPKLHIRRQDEIGILTQTFVDMEKKLRFDKLTQVANRESLFAKITYLQKNSKENPDEENGFTLLFVDLDRFKQVNDSHGHDAGDQVLMITAARLLSAIRDTDDVARYGGDEFVLLLRDTKNSIDIHNMVEKISSLVEEPIALDNAVVEIGASIGWACFPEDGDEYVQLIKIADSRMYNSKRDRKSGQLIHIV
ncbi:diguanylate cyclase [Undibacterium sp. FT79W]|uniref:sensor domain-containing diguanylate cyclase n=1 Tax=unclassified Undibacterium TaxID=2630295 RepID=UPI00164C33B4|nr:MULTISPECIES: sensor domain-containing diguanylate cyclase [unclassified Undibacterium]MBC3877381.1 diguanylate cyclase [Undibacterium sp. FT79W]MBK1888709.1 diguanylate cyclase [Undibacterium sp. 14-3-2]